MSNRNIMLSALKKHTLPLLAERGFTGKYPHFRRICNDCVELISFQTNKWGVSFTVEASAIFPQSNDKNYQLCEGEGDTDDNITVFSTNRRYRLPGMFDGWFYYRDVYRTVTLLSGTYYHDVPEKEAHSFAPPRGWKLVQKFDEDTAEQICKQVNAQMEQAYQWLTEFEQKHRSGRHKFLLQGQRKK